MSEQAWWVYMIETDKGHLYTGITIDVERRFAEHQAAFAGSPKVLAKKGAKYFRANKPLLVVYKQFCTNRAEASRQEAFIKSLPRASKLNLVTRFNL